MLTPARPKDTSGLALGAALSAPSVTSEKIKPLASNFLGEIAGQVASKDALKRLTEEVSNQKRSAARPLLMRAMRAVNSGDYVTGRELAIEGLKKDEQNGFGWYILGMALEIAGDFAGSIRAYEAALKLLPNHEHIANDLGRLALRLGMYAQAEKLFRHHLVASPTHVDAINNLGTALREMGRYEEAIEIVRPAIIDNPESAPLWNTVGTIMGDMGDLENARTFFAEAIRLNPEFPRAHHNLANMLVLAGDAQGSLEHAEKAIAGAVYPSDKVMMRMARFNALAALGRLPDCWEEYETRLDHHFQGGTVFALSGRVWAPGDDICGKTFMVLGEQGLGDEILFASVLPDVLDDLGPDGKLVLVVEHRLVNLFQQSFPQATVVAHRTGIIKGRATRIPMLEDLSHIDLWVPIASLLRGYRKSHDAFSDRRGFMRPEAERLAHWRTVLDGAPKGPKVGLLWKSGATSGARHRYFSPLEQWRPVLTTPGVTFVNLQYGDCEADLAYIKDKMGVEVWQPPEIDLKQDLDGVAALSASCDLVIGFSNATFNIAAGCGAPCWLIIGANSWPRLGLKDRYLWYPQARVFGQEGFGDWDSTMGRIGEALREWVGERQAA